MLISCQVRLSVDKLMATGFEPTKLLDAVRSSAEWYADATKHATYPDEFKEVPCAHTRTRELAHMRMDACAHARAHARTHTRTHTRI